MIGGSLTLSLWSSDAHCPCPRLPEPVRRCRARPARASFTLSRRAGLHVAVRSASPSRRLSFLGHPDEPDLEDPGRDERPPDLDVALPAHLPADREEARSLRRDRCRLERMVAPGATAR